MVGIICDRTKNRSTQHIAQIAWKHCWRHLSGPYVLPYCKCNCLPWLNPENLAINQTLHRIDFYRSLYSSNLLSCTFKKEMVGCLLEFYLLTTSWVTDGYWLVAVSTASFLIEQPYWKIRPPEPWPDTFSCHWPNQSLPYTNNAKCLTRKEAVSRLKSWVWLQQGSNICRLIHSELHGLVWLLNL